MRCAAWRPRQRLRRGVLRSARSSSDEDCDKVLVTGHHGYIGSVPRPAARPATTSPGSTPSSTRAATSATAEWTPARRDVRDVEPRRPRRVRRGRPPRGAVERPARRPQRRSGPTRSTSTARVALARAAKAAGVGGSSSPRRASMYGAAAGDELLDENAPLRPLTAYAESKVRAEEALHALADDDFHRSSCATRRPTASRRGCGSTSCSTTSSAGRTRPGDRLQSDGTPGGRSCTSRTSRAPSLALLEAPREGVHERGVQRRLGGAELPDPRARRHRAATCCPSARSTFAEGAARTRAATASTSRSSQRAFPECKSSGRERGAASSPRRTAMPA